MQSVTLKAAPAKESAKPTGAAKGSWGKPTTKTEGPEMNGTRTTQSDGTSGFEIPVTTSMFEADRI